MANHSTRKRHTLKALQSDLMAQTDANATLAESVLSMLETYERREVEPDQIETLKELAEDMILTAAEKREFWLLYPDGNSHKGLIKQVLLKHDVASMIV